MNPVSPDQVESTRKIGASIQGTILRRLADVTQSHAATCMGVDASTVSRTKDDLERVCQLMAALGLQVSRTTSMVVDRDELRFMKRVVAKYLIAELEQDES